ncbi:MAG: GNAT family protein [Pseudomonadota bacterium]
MLLRRKRVRIETDRLTLRPPQHGDYREWASLRDESRAFLSPWEPTWAADHLTRRSFTNRVYWAQRSVASGRALPLFLFDRKQATLVGAVTIDNVQRGPSQSATLGYWAGEKFARQGYVSEAVEAVVHQAFTAMDLSRITAGCLAENAASRGLLEKCGFKYEGVAQAYLQINGKWRNHVLYANLRSDRRGAKG